MQKASLWGAWRCMGGGEGGPSLNTDIATGRCIDHRQEIEIGSASMQLMRK